MNFVNNNWYILVRDIVIIVLLIIIILFNIDGSSNKEVVESKIIEYKNESKVEEIKINNNEDKIYVDIKGAINNPGVYQMSSNSIINNLIEIAGGVKKNANLNSINLSKKLKDEMVIYIYTDKELKKMKSNKEENNIIVEKEECICPTEVITSCEGKSIITTDEAYVDSSSNEVLEEKDTKININTASKEELMTISGIGESKANSIIEYRNSNGNYKSIEDIMNVSGIGEALFAKIKDYIRV